MAITVKQRFSELEGVPDRDDPELAVLMEAAARLPEAGVQEVIANLLRAALGWERSGNPVILTSAAETALVTFRSRRDAEDQAALDARPDQSATPEDGGLDVDEMVARYST
jgi:hypothetical protein